ncbi:MAG: hypothetical protein GY909_15845 [Oligoflexia bacterium]|nr:hypothetical protein [Oligoflexia bacterium]
MRALILLPIFILSCGKKEAPEKIATFKSQSFSVISYRELGTETRWIPTRGNLEVSFKLNIDEIESEDDTTFEVENIRFLYQGYRDFGSSGNCNGVVSVDVERIDVSGDSDDESFDLFDPVNEESNEDELVFNYQVINTEDLPVFLGSDCPFSFSPSSFSLKRGIDQEWKLGDIERDLEFSLSLN